MIQWESVITALQGTVLGLLVGVFFGWALVLAMRNQGITVFSPPVPSLVLVVVLAGLTGVAAANVPSPAGSEAQHHARHRQRMTRRFPSAPIAVVESAPPF